MDDPDSPFVGEEVVSKSEAEAARVALQQQVEQLKAIIEHSAPIASMTEQDVRQIAGYQRDARMVILKELSQAKADLRALRARVQALEDRFRQEWWVGHGCPFSALYGDDGELQCNRCMIDFKRLPFEELQTKVEEARLREAHGRAAALARAPEDS